MANMKRVYCVYAWNYNFTTRHFEGAYDTFEEAQQRVDFLMNLGSEFYQDKVFRITVDDWRISK